MSHTCPDCFIECRCNGDIDDCCMNTDETVLNCKHFLQPDCDGYEGDDDDDWDDVPDGGAE